MGIVGACHIIDRATLGASRNPAPLEDKAGSAILLQSELCTAGVLYFGDSAAGGEKASTYVTELHSREDFERFVNQQDDKVSSAARGALRQCSQWGTLARTRALDASLMHQERWSRQTLDHGYFAR